MKNLIILALTSMLLFSVSAGLSIWLKQSKDEAAKPEKETKKEPEKKEAEKKAEKDDHAKPAEKPDTSHGPDTGDVARTREEKLQKRAERIELVLKDAREVQEAHDRLAKQVATEAKAALERNNELENRAGTLQKQKNELELGLAEAKKAPPPADLKKAQAEADAAEAKSLDTMATLIEAMPSEKAAANLQEMANTGKLETAGKLLARMKPRQAAKVLSEISDFALAGQLMDKMRAAVK